MIENAIRAARLDVAFYNAVEEDTRLTGQAGLLVAVVSLLSAIGTWFLVDGNLLGLTVSIVVGGLVTWVIWSFVADLVGRKLFGGTSDLGQMLRVIGYAHAPLALGIVPGIGSVVGAIWMLVAAVVAIREGHDFTTGKAVGTVIVGWLLVVVVRAVVFAILP